MKQVHVHGTVRKLLLSEFANSSIDYTHEQRFFPFTERDSVLEISANLMITDLPPAPRSNEPFQQFDQNEFHLERPRGERFTGQCCPPVVNERVMQLSLVQRHEAASFPDYENSIKILLIAVCSPGNEN